LVGEGVEGKMPVSVFVCIHVLCFVPRTEKTFTLLLSEKKQERRTPRNASRSPSLGGYTWSGGVLVWLVFLVPVTTAVSLWVPPPSDDRVGWFSSPLVPISLLSLFSFLLEGREAVPGSKILPENNLFYPDICTTKPINIEILGTSFPFSSMFIP